MNVETLHNILRLVFVYLLKHNQYDHNIIYSIFDRLMKTKRNNLFPFFFEKYKQNKDILKTKLDRFKRILIRWFNQLVHQHQKKQSYRQNNKTDFCHLEQNEILNSNHYNRQQNKSLLLRKLKLNDNDLNKITYVFKQMFTDDQLIRNTILTTHLRDCILEYINVIDYPYTKKKKKDILFYYETFMIEFIKIENVLILKTNTMKLYVLRVILRLAKMIQMSYTSQNKQEQKRAHDLFVQQCYRELHLYLPYFDVNVDILLCSLFVFLNKFEGVLYNIIDMNKCNRIKNKNLIINSL